MADPTGPGSFSVHTGGDGITLVGIIDETADLSFFARLSAPTRVNLRGVRRINSYGVRTWIESVRRVPAGVAVELVECSPSMVDQLNMVAGFTGRAKVISFYAPMACDGCGHEMEQLFSVAEVRQHQRLPLVSCPRCATAMHIDDLEDHYLLFVREPE